MYGQPIAKPEFATNDGTVKHDQTRIVEVYMAGDIDHAKQIIRRFCKENPICVTVAPTSFIYRGGEEAGFVVGFRNYPRFPTDSYSLRRTAGELSETLRDALGQDSCMVVDVYGQTTWRSDRDA